MNFKKSVAIAAAVGALSAVAIPAMADTTFYGSARVGTFWDTSRAAHPYNGVDADSATDFDMRNQATSRFGVIASNGNLGGKIELGLGNLAAGQAAGNTSGAGASIGTGGNTNVYTRLLFGTYKFDGGTLMVGQNYTPYWQNSEQVAIDDQGNNGFGSIYDGRQPQIKFTMNNGLYVAAIRPGTPATVFATTQTSFPKLAIGYDGKFGNLAIGGGVAGQTYINQAAGVDKHINSLLGYVHGKLTAGPADFGFNIGVGQNLGDMGLSEGIAANASGITINDTLTASILLTGGFKVSDALKINAGFGYVNTNGKTGTGTTQASYLHPDNKLSTFVNAPVTLAKGVSITPEFTYQDQLNDAAAKGQRDYIWGAKWQMDF